MYVNRIAALMLVTALLPGSVPAREAAGATEAEIIGPPPEAGSLQGKVFGRDGKTPVSGAVVYAYHLDSDEVFASANTDGKGRYVLEGLPLGWFDLFVRTEEGVFVANHVVNIPPKSKISASLTLKGYADESSWFSGTSRRSVPGIEEAATGVAQLDRTAKGRSFWAKPAGIGILAGGGALVLLGILLAGQEDSASPFAPASR